MAFLKENFSKQREEKMLGVFSVLAYVIGTKAPFDLPVVLIEAFTFACLTLSPPWFLFFNQQLEQKPKQLGNHIMQMPHNPKLINHLTFAHKRKDCALSLPFHVTNGKSISFENKSSSSISINCQEQIINCRCTSFLISTCFR